MGRWAEVYFTSAPEKREQAVLDLLRELQRENPEREATPPVSEQASRTGAEPAAPIAEGRAGVATCHACGRENPASHRFCGMCGTAVFNPADLNADDLNAAHLNADLNGDGLNGADIPVEDLHVDDRHVEYPARSALAPLVSSNAASRVASDAPRNESRFVAPENALFDSPLLGHESTQHQGSREDTYSANYSGGFLDPAPASRSYRVPLVIALAVVLVALAYLTWRNMQAPDTSQVAPQAPPAVMTQPGTSTGTSSPTPANPSTIDNSDRTSAASNRAGVPSHDAADGLSHEANAKTDTLSRAASTSSILGKNPQVEPLAGNGGQELAMAQRYLNGTAGQARDSAEAAKWLWKAIAKHNGEATLLLADLYQKGDGVAKNCDQAHILLDAAAVRSVPGAAERLRNLQAFGCS